MAARGITSTPLPPPPDGYYSDRYQVGVDGRLLGLFSTFDTKSAVRRFRAAQKSNPAVSLENIPAGAEGVLAVAVGTGWRPLVSFPFSTYAFDTAPDGCCVIARRRCEPDEANATVFLGGAEIARFHAGDGINHLQCDNRGGVWTGYFDEGVFGDTIGRYGIVRFTRDGEVASYQAGDIADCYALNVARDATWSCWYSDFPLVTLDDNCSEQRWSNNLASGVSAVAVSSPYALLVGTYDERSKLTLAKMHGDQLRLVRAFDARDALGVDLTEAWFTARNDCLFVVDAECAYTAPVSHFVAAGFR